ncbi:MAG: hypothetical protein PHS66_04735 [Candidatus Omnitrophica bacterium]|nr:hypothetical protein [Candidatus Omnitrophota bacterium]
MAQERSLTPEKQLLKIIETSKMNSTGVHTQSSRRHGMSWLSFGAWLGRISFFRVRLEKWSQGFSLEQLDVKAVNRILGLLVALLLTYFSANFIVSLFNINKTPSLESNNTLAAKMETSFPEPVGLKKAASYYLEKVRERDIFTMGAKKAAAASTAPSSKNLELAASLKLVGISWSNDPDAMVEDTKALKTFFVKRGDMVGDARVQAIFKDKIILSLDNEEFELK